jgi:hypothetical protein
LNDALDRMPLNAQHTALVGISAIQTVHWLRSAFEELVDCTLTYSQLGPEVDRISPSVPIGQGLGDKRRGLGGGSRT